MQFSSEIPPISFILSYFVLYYNIISLINIIFFQQKNDLEQSSKSFGADDRGRTGTGISSHGILSPLCFGGLKNERYFIKKGSNRLSYPRN